MKDIIKYWYINAIWTLCSWILERKKERQTFFSTLPSPHSLLFSSPYNPKLSKKEVVAFRLNRSLHQHFLAFRVF